MWPKEDHTGEWKVPSHFRIPLAKNRVQFPYLDLETRHQCPLKGCWCNLTLKYYVTVMCEYTWLILTLAAPLVAFIGLFLVARYFFLSRRPSRFTVAFFHPYWYVQHRQGSSIQPM